MGIKHHIKISKINITIIFLFTIALILTAIAITIHTINAQTAELLWGTPLGGIADLDRYSQIEWIVRTFTIGAIAFFGSSFGLTFYKILLNCEEG